MICAVPHICMEGDAGPASFGYLFKIIQVPAHGGTNRRTDAAGRGSCGSPLASSRCRHVTTRTWQLWFAWRRNPAAMLGAAMLGLGSAHSVCRLHRSFLIVP